MFKYIDHVALHVKNRDEVAKFYCEIFGFHVHYALKANFNEQILQAVRKIGFGADCVSGNEVKKAIEIGFDPEKVVFAGVGKSDKEIIEALNNNIYCFNIESVQELGIINRLATDRGKTARVAIRINPNVDAHTHQYITTGLEENKFGVNQWELDSCIEQLKACPNLNLIGIHFHIGSQITNLEVFKSLCIKVNELNSWFEDRGFQLQILNVGGGLGVDYHAPDENSINDAVKGSDLVILHTEWNDFKSINFKKLHPSKNLKIYDMRNIYSPIKIKSQGFQYFGIGR